MNSLSEQREFIDNLVATETRQSCRRGCSFCCHYEVVITDEEADEFVDMIMEGQVQVNRVKLELHNFLGQDDIEPKDKACIFLNENNDCNVYNKRPLMCRRYMVNTPPEDCEVGSGKMKGILRSEKIEKMLTRLDKGYMPKKIYERLKNAHYI